MSEVKMYMGSQLGEYETVQISNAGIYMNLTKITKMKLFLEA